MIGSAPAGAEPWMLLHRLEPFVVAPRWRFDALDLLPFGVPIMPSSRFDILSTASARFLDRLVHLDRITFGPEGMPMPAWLFVDGSALPGVISGLGLRARALPPQTRERLGFDARDNELVPLAMYIAVPARPPAVWYGHNLASLNQQAPELGLRGLAGVTKALGLCVMRCTEQLGATQWTSAALHVHTRFGPLELLSAWTPAHADPATLTYRLRLTDEGIADVLHGRRAAPWDHEPTWIDAHDLDAIRSLEHRIEHGEQFAVVGPPRHDAQGACVPIAPFSPRPAA